MFSADIHARCDWYFCVCAANLIFSANSTAFKTPRLLWLALASQASHNFVRCLTRVTPSHQEMLGSVTSVSRWTWSGPPPTAGGKRPSMPRPTVMRGISGALDLPLGGNFFHHQLAPSCLRVDTRSVGGTPWATHPLCSLLTWYSEQKSQPLSRQCFTRDTWHRMRFTWSLCRHLRQRSPPPPRQVASRVLRQHPAGGGLRALRGARTRKLDVVAGVWDTHVALTPNMYCCVVGAWDDKYQLCGEGGGEIH